MSFLDHGFYPNTEALNIIFFPSTSLTLLLLCKHEGEGAGMEWISSMALFPKGTGTPEEKE